MKIVIFARKADFPKAKVLFNDLQGLLSVPIHVQEIVEDCCQQISPTACSWCIRRWFANVSQDDALVIYVPVVERVTLRIDSDTGDATHLSVINAMVAKKFKNRYVLFHAQKSHRLHNYDLKGFSFSRFETQDEVIPILKNIEKGLERTQNVISICKNIERIENTQKETCNICRPHIKVILTILGLIFTLSIMITTLDQNILKLTRDTDYEKQWDNMLQMLHDINSECNIYKKELEDQKQKLKEIDLENKNHWATFLRDIEGEREEKSLELENDRNVVKKLLQEYGKYRKMIEDMSKEWERYRKVIEEISKDRERDGSKDEEIPQKYTNQMSVTEESWIESKLKELTCTIGVCF